MIYSQRTKLDYIYIAFYANIPYNSISWIMDKTGGVAKLCAHDMEDSYANNFCIIEY